MSNRSADNVHPAQRVHHAQRVHPSRLPIFIRFQCYTPTGSIDTYEHSEALAFEAKAKNAWIISLTVKFGPFAWQIRLVIKF